MFIIVKDFETWWRNEKEELFCIDIIFCWGSWHFKKAFIPLLSLNPIHVKFRFNFISFYGACRSVNEQCFTHNYVAIVTCMWKFSLLYLHLLTNMKDNISFTNCFFEYCFLVRMSFYSYTTWYILYLKGAFHELILFFKNPNRRNVLLCFVCQMHLFPAHHILFWDINFG